MEFGCNNGRCIPMEERCNEVSNCDDSSDELDCDMLDFDDDQVVSSPSFRALLHYTTSLLA